MIEIWVRDRDDPRNTQKRPFFRIVPREGRLFLVGGKEVELFTVQAMAEAIDRIPKTISILERRGLFPRPLYKVKGSGRGDRWYSATQVVNANAIFYYGFGGLKRLHVNGFRKGNTDEDRMTAFMKALTLVFYEKEVLQGMEKVHEIIKRAGTWND
jgi:hypothetical protein